MQKEEKVKELKYHLLQLNQKRSQLQPSGVTTDKHRTVTIANGMPTKERHNSCCDEMNHVLKDCDSALATSSIYKSSKASAEEYSNGYC